MLSVQNEVADAEWVPSCVSRLRGATVARLTPDQKVACSNHVGVKWVILRVLRGNSQRLPSVAMGSCSYCSNVAYELEAGYDDATVLPIRLLQT